MKTIIYILLIAMVAGIVFSAVPAPQKIQAQTVTLQGVESLTSDQLYKTAAILTKRLNDAGVSNSKVYVQSARNVLVVDLNGVTDVNLLLPLLTGKGTLGFYETCDRAEVVSALPAGDPLFSLMHIPAVRTSEMIARDVLGSCRADNMAAAEARLKEHKLLPNGEKVGFSWSLQGNPEGQYDLHLLKSRADLDRSMVLNTSLSGEGSDAALLISFNAQGAQAWQSLSAANIGKSIALVIDGREIMDPTVRDEIKNGKCMVTGNFNAKELLVLKALVNNDELPAALKVIQ